MPKVLIIHVLLLISLKLKDRPKDQSSNKGKPRKSSSRKSITPVENYSNLNETDNNVVYNFNHLYEDYFENNQSNSIYSLTNNNLLLLYELDFCIFNDSTKEYIEFLPMACPKNEHNIHVFIF